MTKNICHLEIFILLSFYKNFSFSHILRLDHTFPPSLHNTSPAAPTPSAPHFSSGKGRPPKDINQTWQIKLRD